MTRYWNWDPFREMDVLQKEINRLFSDRSRGWESPFARGSFLPGQSARAYPRLNMTQDSDNVYVEALAPGIDPDKLDLSVLRNQLQITGEKAGLADVKPEMYHRNERSAGKFVRSITLPVEVEADKVQAEYRNGVLKITLPKAEAAKPRQISVSVN